MGKYFWGNPAYYSNKINEKSRKEKQALRDDLKKIDVAYIKYLLRTGLSVDDPEVQFELEISNLTLEDIGIVEANDYQETKKFDYGR
mgnify:CR=1 FL=1